MLDVRSYLPTIMQAAWANPNAYAKQTVPVPHRALAEAQQMASILHRLTEFSTLQQTMLEGLPQAARHSQGPVGSIFSCIDYHLTEGGLRLIEINTHGSGGLASALWQIHLQDNGRVQNPLFGNPEMAIQQYWETLENDWAAFTARGDRQLRKIAIVDDTPTTQPFYNEFLLAQSMLRERGYAVDILDAGRSHTLAGAELVYNRCCDFYFETSEHRWLSDALLRDEALFTPNPRVHAIIGRKDILVYLSQIADGGLPDAPLSSEDRAFLRRIVPTAHFLTDVDRDVVWTQRRQLVLKPRDGFQAKGVFRGKSLSHRTFDTLPSAEYIVQEYVPPSCTDDGLKAEIRFYHYRNSVLFGAARLYEGQVTNFQSTRGGNAPLVLAS